MNIEQCMVFCRDSAAPAGSDLYYSTLFAPEAEKRALLALHAFAGEIKKILRAVSDPGLARIKLGWWREEIRRTWAGTPGHPIAFALHASCNRLTDTALLALTDAGEEAFATQRLPDVQSCIAACRGFEGLLWRLSAEVLGHIDNATPLAVESLGCAFGLYELLRGLREDLKAGILRLPRESLERAGLAPEDLLAPADPHRLAALAVFVAGYIRQLVLEGIAALPRRDRLRQLPALIMTELLIKTLAEDQADGFRILERRLTLTPLRKLWIAFRTRRRERRLDRLASRRP